MVVDCNVDGRHKKYREFLECIEGSFFMHVAKKLSKKDSVWVPLNTSQQ